MRTIIPLKTLLKSALLGGAFLSTLAFAEAGTLLKADSLRAKPFGDAEVIATLKAGGKVEITARKGAWASVQVPAGKSGWIRLLNVRTGSGQSGDSGVGALASLFKTGSSGNTVSTGVKGLSEEQLKNAKPDPEEARRLGNYKDTEADARSFARQGKLVAQKVDYLPADNGGNQ